MKKSLVYLLSCALLLCAVMVGVFTLPASAGDYDWDNAKTSGDYTYVVENKKAIILSVDESISGAVTIPSKLGGYTVTTIAECAFESRDLMTTLTIPDSVTTIEEGAFGGCDNLLMVAIGNGVTYIGSGAFQNCEKMLMLTLGNKVKTIENGAFASCKELISLTIPNSVVNINGEEDEDWGYGGAFEYCSSLEEITLGTGVKHIGGRAFRNCSSVASIVIPDATTEIGSRAFMGCTELTTVTLGKNVASIGISAFENCNKLTAVSVPNSVKTLGSYAFAYCEKLTSAVVGNNVPAINEATFYKCKNLTSVTLGSGVTSIGTAAFANCTSLKELVLPKDLKEITSGDFYGDDYDICGAFQGCTALTTVTFNDQLKTIDRKSFSNCTALRKIVIPDSVTTIGENAFLCCRNLNEVVIGNGVAAIPRAAFLKCINLTSVTIGENVITIGAIAFGDCTSLTSVVIPDSVVSLYSGDYEDWENSYEWYEEAGAFWGCTSLKEVQLGKMVTSLSANTFGHCSNLTDIYVDSANLMYSSNEGVLFNRKKTALIYCPAGRKSILLPSTVTTIENGALSDCTKLVGVWFLGTQSQYDNIEVGENNQRFEGASVYYYYCTGEHTWASDCDTDCNKCGWIREASDPHELDDEEDIYKVLIEPTCQSEGLKEYTCINCDNTWIKTMNKSGHKYDNACDTYCNVCWHYRSTRHNYKAATCTAPETCKGCGITSGYALGHTYTNACDTSCNVCKATRSIKHTYTNACDTSCNVCKATRKVSHSYKTVTKTATATANGYTVKRCSVCKAETGKTTIYKASTIKLSKTTYTYNGKVQKPTVTIKDSKGNKIASSNYSITYASGCKNVGTYKVTVKFKGKYSGTKTLTFKINPAGTTVKSVSAAKKKLTVAITKKTAQVTGYEVQYSTNKSFKSAKSKSLTKTSLSLTGLKTKTTYYVRVRTYKTVNGVKYYSAWSTAKSKKTK